MGLGSNLNSQNIDGDTPLHLAMSKRTVDPLTEETPELKKVITILDWC